MKTYTYYCPFGSSLIRAATQKELDGKIADHNTISHGPNPIITCAAALDRPEHQPDSAAARCRHSAQVRPAQQGYTLRRKAV